MIVPIEALINRDSASMQLLSGIVGLSLLTFIGVNAVETIGRILRRKRASLRFKIDAASLTWRPAVPALFIATPVAVAFAAPLTILQPLPPLLVAIPNILAGAVLHSTAIPI
jgi:hypothetical protein